MQHGAGSSTSSPLPPAPPLSVYRDAVSEKEEARLVRETEAWLQRRPYEGGHFDGVIKGYREVQKPLRAFSPASRAVLDRLIAATFPADAPLLPVHILDLQPDGAISKHVDHVEYSGDAIVGLSLLSSAVMTLHHEPRGYHDVPAAPPRGGGDGGGADSAGQATEATGGEAVDAEGGYDAPWLALRLPRRSLYVLRGAARYEWAHAMTLDSRVPRLREAFEGNQEALAGEGGGDGSSRGRRLALILRDAKST